MSFGYVTVLIVYIKFALKHLKSKAIKNIRSNTLYIQQHSNKSLALFYEDIKVERNFIQFL